MVYWEPQLHIFRNCPPWEPPVIKVPFLITTQHWTGLRTLCELSSSSVSFNGKISPNFNLKSTISTYIQVFLSWRKWPKFARFWRKKIPNCQIFKVSSIRKSRILKEFVLSLLAYLVCSQTRIKYFLEDCRFDNITKSLKETLLSSRCQRSGHTQDRVDSNSVPLTHPHRSRRAMIKAWWTSLSYNRDNKRNRNISIVSTYYYIPEPEAFWCIHQYL